METYFCPSCGKSYESKECLPPGTSSFRLCRLDCPDCKCALQLTGAQFIIGGLLAGLFFSMILCYEAELLGEAIVVICVPLGFIRLVRQWLMQWRKVRPQTDDGR